VTGPRRGAFACESFTAAILIVRESNKQLRPGAQLPIRNNFQWNRILRALGLLRALNRFLYHPLEPPGDRLIAPNATPQVCGLSRAGETIPEPSQQPKAKNDLRGAQNEFRHEG
jgi:hypothetical protein